MYLNIHSMEYTVTVSTSQIYDFFINIPLKEGNSALKLFKAINSIVVYFLYNFNGTNHFWFPERVLVEDGWLRQYRHRRRNRCRWIQSSVG